MMSRILKKIITFLTAKREDVGCLGCRDKDGILDPTKTDFTGQLSNSECWKLMLGPGSWVTNQSLQNLTTEANTDI